MALMTDFLFFIEVLVGGLLSGVMYSLVAIGFVLIYKTSGVLNFAQGAMVLFAALTFVSLVERGLPFAARARRHLRGHGRCSASASSARCCGRWSTAADHPVHGDARPLLGHRGRGAAPLGHPGARARPRHRRHAVRGRRRLHLDQFDLVAARDRRRHGRGPHRLLPLDPHRPRLPRRRRRPVRRARGRPAPAADLGARSGPLPASSRWSPACSGARGSACSSRCR